MFYAVCYAYATNRAGIDHKERRSSNASFKALFARRKYKRAEAQRRNEVLTSSIIFQIAPIDEKQTASCGLRQACM